MTRSYKIHIDNSGLILSLYQADVNDEISPGGLLLTEEQYNTYHSMLATHFIDGEFKVIKTVEAVTKEDLRESFLISREIAVSNITVEVEGMIFDGDEISQDRMARSIVAMEDNELKTWVLHNNSVVELSKTQLKQALRLAGLAQTEMWLATV